MARVDTVVKGEIAQTNVILDLLNKGYEIYTPYGDHAPFDIVAYRDNRFIRIQVKHIKKYNGTIRILFRNVHCNTKGYKHKSVDVSQVDYYAIYCPDTAAIYYIDPKKHNTGVWLRVDPPKNNQVEGVSFAENFRDVD